MPKRDEVPCTGLLWDFPHPLPPCQGGMSLGRCGAGSGLHLGERAPHVPAFSAIGLFGEDVFSPMRGFIPKKEKISPNRSQEALRTGSSA